MTVCLSNFFTKMKIVKLKMSSQKKITCVLNKKKMLSSVPENENMINKMSSSDKKPYKMQIVWQNVFIMIILHCFAFYGFLMFGSVKRSTFLFAIFLSILSSLGVQAGAHRLWSHRSYKANFAFRLLLCFCQTLALQNDIYVWCRDHRAHHLFSDTDADPHNSSRSFFFSHVSWLLVKKHPEVLRRGKTIHLSDLVADPIVRFQRRFYIPLVVLIWGLLPTFIPVYCWGESVWLSFLVCVTTRYAYTLNIAWLVNSWAHKYGTRGYNQSIAPVEASIRHLLFGEGFHNYHHTFPWDYSASELGPADVFNPTTAIIDLFALIGWVWDRKKVNSEQVKAKMASSGDQTAVKLMKHDSGISGVVVEWIGGMVAVFGHFYLIWYFFIE